MKKILIILALLTAFAPAAFAEQCSKSGCPKSAYSNCQKCEGEKESCCPILGKIQKKAHFFLDNSAAIGLSDEQVKTIKGIKMWAKKAEIQQGAGMQVFMLDMKSKLSEETFDAEGTKALIDKATSEMAAGAKEGVDNYAKLKAVLTPDQMAKAKEIWKKK